jgi:hypothetical protein
MAKENAVGWKAKRSGLNTIIGTPENPTEFESGQVIINKKSTKKNLDKLIEINNDGKKSNSPGKVTNDATDGGLLKGKPHYDKNGKATGGIPGIVDGGKMIETEGDEFVVNKEASEEHWKELSEINQADGNGVAINPPSGIDDDPQEYKEGGKIEFNPNKLPKKSILKYAEMIRTKYPEIWKLGGNIFGNQAFKNLKRVSERGYWEDSEEWMYIKWRSYVARHIHDFRIEGVIAMLKWVDTVEKGWPYMKQLIEEKIDKIESKKKGWKHKADKMKDGGNTNNSNNKDENKKRTKKESIIEEAISYISRGVSAAKEKQPTGISEQKIKDLESQFAFDFAIKKGIWHGDLKNLPKPIGGGGNENSLYYDENTGIIYKSNNLFNSNFSILEYLNYLLYHNRLFPNTKYNFFGFIGFSNNYPSITSAIPFIEPIVTQKYILGESATQDQIENSMLKIGFEKINEHTFKKDSFIVSDLRPRNVIKDSEGDIFVIDNIIKPQSKMKDGGSVDNISKSFVIFFKSKMSDEIIYVPIEDSSISLDEAIERQRNLYSWMDIKWIKGFEVNKGTERLELFLQNMKDKWETNPDLSVKIKNGQIVFSKGRDSVAFDVAILFKVVSTSEKSLTMFNRAHMTNGNTEIIVDDNFNFDKNKVFELILNKMKDGGSVAQTPAPKKERIVGSAVNKPKSSSSAKSGSSIEFSKELTDTISDKVKEHNEAHPNKKITLSVAKAVVRRGMGAYSSSHRPTITGGQPNSRTAWGLARLNAFTYKIIHGKSKSGKYKQDDDLIEELGYKVAKYHLGGDMSKHLAPNGKPSNLTHEQWHLVRTPEFKAWFGDWENDPVNASKVVDENGEPLVMYHGTKSTDIEEFDLSKSKRKSSGLKEFAHFFTSNKELALLYREASEIKEDLLKSINDKINSLTDEQENVRNNRDWERIQNEIDLLRSYKRGKIYSLFLNVKKPFEFDAETKDIDGWNNARIDVGYDIKKGRTAVLEAVSGNNDAYNSPYDGLIAYNLADLHTSKQYKIENLSGTVAAIWNPNQIKLADGTNTTFDSNNPDIRYAEGGEMDDQSKIFSASSRFRPVETIFFDPALIGPNGNKLISYTWKYQWTVDFNKTKGEEIEKRVSDWTQAEESAETGRNIVHAYTIEKPNGEVVTISSESVPVLMGLVDREQKKVFANLATASKTLAKQQMKLAILEAQQKEYEDAKKSIIDAGYPEITIEPGWDENDVKLIMGNGSVRSDASNPLTEERVRTLQESYIKGKLKKIGIDPYKSDVSFQIGKLKPLIDRQKRKVENIIATEKMAEGGSVDNNVELVSVDYLNSIRNQDKSMWNYDLEKSIEKEGVLEPVTIGYWPEYDKVTLLDGHHRLDTAIDLDIESVPAQIELYYYDPTRKHRLHPVPKYNLMAKKPSDLGIFKDGGSVDAKDTLTIDIPLMIRLLELSREDVHSDAELHMVVERLLDLKNKPVLTMDDYTYIAEIEHKHLKKKMDLGGNLETEKLIAKAHDNLTWKRGRKEYAPTTSEIQEEIDRMIMEQQFGSTNI